MGRFNLREAVTKKAEVTYDVRGALYANRCDGCGKVFRMVQWCREKELAELRGLFNCTADDTDGRGLGNGFSATVCSFACAHLVVALDGWKKMDEYAPFAELAEEEDVRIVRAELRITTQLLSENELVSEWEGMERVIGHNGSMEYPERGGVTFFPLRPVHSPDRDAPEDAWVTDLLGKAQQHLGEEGRKRLVALVEGLK